MAVTFPGQSGTHGIGGALANEAAVDVHEGEHDVLLMCSMCTVHGDVQVFCTMMCATTPSGARASDFLPLFGTR